MYHSKESSAQFKKNNFSLFCLEHLFRCYRGNNAKIISILTIYEQNNTEIYIQLHTTKCIQYDHVRPATVVTPTHNQFYIRSYAAHKVIVICMPSINLEISTSKNEMILKGMVIHKLTTQVSSKNYQQDELHRSYFPALYHNLKGIYFSIF